MHWILRKIREMARTAFKADDAEENGEGYKDNLEYVNR